MDPTVNHKGIEVRAELIAKFSMMILEDSIDESSRVVRGELGVNCYAGEHHGAIELKQYDIDIDPTFKHFDLDDFSAQVLKPAVLDLVCQVGTVGPIVFGELGLGKYVSEGYRATNNSVSIRYCVSYDVSLGHRIGTLSILAGEL